MASKHKVFRNLAALGLVVLVVVALRTFWRRAALLNQASVVALQAAMGGNVSGDPAALYAGAQEAGASRAGLGAGRQAFLQGEWMEAENDLRTYLARAPRDQVAVYFLARALMVQNRDDKLPEVLNTTVPVGMIALFTQEELKKGNFDLAQRLWRGVLDSGRGAETGPFGINSLLALEAYKLLDCQSTQFWLEDALHWQQQGLQVINPAFLPLMFYNLGKCYIQAGDNRAAYSGFQRSVEFDPGFSDQAYIYLAYAAYQITQDPAQARQWLDDGLKFFPGNAEILKAMSQYP